MKEDIKFIVKILVTIGLIALGFHWGIAGFTLIIPIYLMWADEENEEKEVEVNDK